MALDFRKNLQYHPISIHNPWIFEVQSVIPMEDVGFPAGFFIRSSIGKSMDFMFQT